DSQSRGPQVGIVVADQKADSSNDHLNQEKSNRVVLNQRSHQRVGFGGNAASDVLHSGYCVVTRHRDRTKNISKQPGILKEDTCPDHGQPLLLSLERANGNGAPDIIARSITNATTA